MTDQFNSRDLLPNIKQTKYIPLTDWPKHHEWPPIGGLRHLVFYSKTNGFDSVVRRAGRRVLINETAFFNWLDQQGGEK